ncbi:uncharacterized protein METZ01_LOCUS313698, partial [marine metagenome]
PDYTRPPHAAGYICHSLFKSVKGPYKRTQTPGGPVYKGTPRTVYEYLLYSRGKSTAMRKKYS